MAHTLSLEPCTQATTLPDWLLLQAFAVAYDQTFASQTDGKINVNLTLSPSFPGSGRSSGSSRSRRSCAPPAWSRACIRRTIPPCPMR
ncbi:MAG: hypothetical protein WDO13_08120 [Verrucomicrobiota bacterium]